MNSVRDCCHLVLLLGVITLSLAGCARTVEPADDQVRKLSSQDPQVRWVTVQLIRDSPPVPDKLIAPLLKALHDDDPRVRRAAAEALAQSGRAGQAALNEIGPLSTSHPDADVRLILQQAVTRLQQAN
jgi:HEAT repeat protein